MGSPVQIPGKKFKKKKKCEKLFPPFFENAAVLVKILENMWNLHWKSF